MCHTSLCISIYTIYMFIFYHILYFCHPIQSSSSPSHYHHHQLRHTKHNHHHHQQQQQNQMVTLDIENCQHHPKFSTRSRHTHTHETHTHTLTCTHNIPYIIASSICCSCNLCFILFINHFEYIFSRFWFCFRFLNLF